MQITRYLMAIKLQLVLLLKYVLHAKLSFIDHNYNYHDGYESCLTPCLLGILTCFFFLSSAVFFFQYQLFRKIFSGIPSECQTVWSQICSGLVLGSNCVQRLSTDDKSRQRVNGICISYDRNTAVLFQRERYAPRFL